ncbi:MAG: tRNA dihydrouridine synthase DusB [Clostridia bacterium]|nr:tRNA dihydrouridine synthase DusB [Clostridia bacterium]
MDKKKIPTLALAPMAGFTDAPFRLMCYKNGCDIAVTEMISAKAMTYRDKKTGELARLPKGDSPTAIQLFGHEPHVMAAAARMIEECSFEGCDFSEKPVAIDINMGCPVKKIALSGDGSALMKDPRLACDIVYSIKNAVSLPVTVKIRAGWDKRSKNAVDVALACTEGGASVVAVHARTREELYNPGIDMDIIARVRDALPPEVQVFGNGDVTDGKSALEMAEKTGCDGIMIGREALGNPWIFDEIKAYFKGEEYLEKTKEERISAAVSLVSSIVEMKGEERGIREARGRAAHFIRGLRGSAEKRAALNSAKSLSEFVSILNEWE